MSSRRVVLTALSALALLAAEPAAAAPEKNVLQSVGGLGRVTCVVTLNKEHKMFWGGEQRYNFVGRTECDAPVQQTGQAWLTNPVAALWAYGPACSGWRTTCESSGHVQGEEYAESRPGPMEYRVTLEAPEGHTWIALPGECTGATTTHVECTFSGTVSDQDTLGFD
jgi:hypothetical protein